MVIRAKLPPTATGTGMYESGITLLTGPEGITDLTGKPLESRGAERSCLKIYGEAISELLPRISSSALKIFLALGSRLGMEDTVVQISCAELEEATCLSKQTVREGLNELEALKLITRMGPNVRRKYVLNQMYIRRCK